METEKLIAALRNNYSPDLHVIEDMQKAADALERLTAQNVAKDAEIERLKEQIAADSQLKSGLDNANALCRTYKGDRDRLQAELDAAVEDIHFALEDLMDAAITPCTYCMGNPLNGGVCDMENENHEMFACWVWRGWSEKENSDGTD